MIRDKTCTVMIWRSWIAWYFCLSRTWTNNIRDIHCSGKLNVMLQLALGFGSIVSLCERNLSIPSSTLKVLVATIDAQWEGMGVMNRPSQRSVFPSYHTEVHYSLGDSGSQYYLLLALGQ